MKELGVMVIWVVALILAAVFCYIVAAKPPGFPHQGLAMIVAIIAPLFCALIATLVIVNAPTEPQ